MFLSSVTLLNILAHNTACDVAKNKASHFKTKSAYNALQCAMRGHYLNLKNFQEKMALECVLYYFRMVITQPFFELQTPDFAWKFVRTVMSQQII